MRSPWADRPASARPAARPATLSAAEPAARPAARLLAPPANGPGHTRERGSVTAEFAAALPAVLLVLALCLGAVQVMGQQVRLSDAAADVARVLARGDGAGSASALLAVLAPGTALAQDRQGEFVCARLSAPSAFAPFAAAGLTLGARSCALASDTASDGP